MAKSIKRSDLYVGQLIVRGEHPDAQVYTIGRIDGLRVTLNWYEGTHLCEQSADYSCCLLPTLKQIEYSIEHNGPLARLSVAASLQEQA
jgi:hypothetical protein